MRLFGALLLALSCCALLAPTAGAAVVGASETEQRLTGIPQNGRTLGRNRAPLTLTYFHELKCPFCKQFSTEVLPRAIRRYVRSGQLKVVGHPLVFNWLDNGADSRRAATAAIALSNQNKYWNFTDLFYTNQKGELDTYVTDEYLTELATAIPGVELDRMFTDRASLSTRKALKRSDRLAERNLVSGVPTLFLTRTGRELTTADHLDHVEPHFSRGIRREIKRLRRR